MKHVRPCFDFLFGVLLIGGSPMCMMALAILFGNSYQSVFQETISRTAGGVIFFVSFATGMTAFAFAIRYRLLHRLLPKGLIVAEILLGIIGAFFLFVYYALIVHFILD